MKNDENETGIPDFIFCGVCLAPRDVYRNIDDLWVVEECEFCGDEHYAYSIQDDTPNNACTGLAPTAAQESEGSTGASQ